MTITQLGTFLKVAETGNFTAAAGLLGYAQSTVTTQIKQLEEELNCLLFERLGKTTALTPEGERLQGYAEKVLQMEREILLEVPTVREPAGTIRLGVSESLCYNRLPRSLMEYKNKYPRVDIRLQFIDHETFPDLLKKGALDIVYTLNPLTEHADLTRVWERREKLGFFAAAGHPLAERSGITEQDLAEVPLLLTSHSCSFRQMLLEDLARTSVTPRIALETSSKEILKQFAINGLGVAFMPEMAAQEEVGVGRLKKLDWRGNDFPVYAQVFVHKDKHMSRAVTDLIGMIREDGNPGQNLKTGSGRNDTDFQ